MLFRSLLLVFRENDAIHACFDHEAQTYYETTHEPTIGVCFRPSHAAEVDRALNTMTVFLRINKELFELARLLNKLEETYADRNSHREESSLRAA